jgi:TrwC relaxase
VLSIGKLSSGQARYYLDQAEVRVDAVDSIGDGIEEYYAGGAEARGTWIGGAARALGLSEGVDGDALRRVLAGLDPHDGSVLRDSSSPVKVAGFDLTFSAPKSVSVVFALGDRDVRGAVRSAHDRATREAVLYLERSAAAVRRGHGGARVERATGLVAAAFGHRTSRLGDPQLHPRPRCQPRPWSGRPLVGARWSAAVLACAGGELRLPGGVARRADADARARVATGPERGRRARRDTEAGAARVQPAAGADRSGDGRARHVGPARR